MVIRRFEVPDYVRSVLICDPTDIWGNVVGIGLGELTAILTPCHRYDKRGSVFFWDDFEDGLAKANPYGSSGSPTQTISSDYAKDGAFSCRLKTGANVGSVSGLLYTRGLIPEGSVGLEVSAAFNGAALYLHLFVNFYDGAEQTPFVIRYCPNTYVLEYLDVTGAFQTIASGLSVGYDPTEWHTLKVVGDTLNDQYMRAFFDGNEYSLAAIGACKAANTTAPKVEIDIYTESLDNNPNDIYIDGIILTQNEPA